VLCVFAVASASRLHGLSQFADGATFGFQALQGKGVVTMTSASILDLRSMVGGGQLFRSPADGNRV
jgi:hypothetical protein